MSESNDRKIEDADPDTNVTGVEKVPVSDGGTAKYVTVEQIKDFVATKFAALANADDVSVSSDGVYLKKDGELKPVAANVFADAIIAFMFDKDAETELAETDEIVISRDGDVKKTTISDIAAIVKEIVEIPNIDIGTLDSIADDEEIWSASQFAVKNDTSDSAPTKKCTADDIGRYLLVEGLLAFAGYADSESFGEYDRIAVVHHGGGSEPVEKGLRLMRANQLPFGNAIAPGLDENETWTDNAKDRIPQWDATKNKLTKGLALTHDVDENSGTDEIPSAAAVYDALSNVGGKVGGPASTTPGKIPQWDANTRVLKDGVELTDSIGAIPVNTKVPTEKAVNDKIEDAFDSALGTGGSITYAISSGINNSLNGQGGAIRAELDKKVNYVQGSTTRGRIVVWDDGARIKDGYSIATSIGSGSAERIPTVQAVADAFTTALGATGSITLAIASAITTALKNGGAIKNALDEKVEDGGVHTGGQIPKWGDDSNFFDGGYGVLDEVQSSAPLQDHILTALATWQTINSRINANRGTVLQVDTKPTDGTTGYELGQIIYVRTLNNGTLCVNTQSPNETGCKFRPFQIVTT